MKKIPDALWLKLNLNDPELPPALNLELVQTTAMPHNVGEAYNEGRITATEARTLIHAIEERAERYIRSQQP